MNRRQAMRHPILRAVISLVPVVVVTAYGADAKTPVVSKMVLPFLTPVGPPSNARGAGQDRVTAATDTARLAFHPLVDRHLSREERTADLAPDLLDIILRVEGMYDPTRVGMFGPALRMKVRPGTASMNNVFADRWTRADDDPNIHYRVRYLAEVWLRPAPRNCEDFSRFRPDDAAVVLDGLTPADCAQLLRVRDETDAAPLYSRIVAAPLDLPVFAAPYPGGRLSLDELRAVEEARIQVIRDQMWFK